MTYLSKGLSGSTLKWIAIVTMFIDHVAAALLVRILWGYGYSEGLHRIYDIMRAIGRVAFPIFCFLLVEGFLHTRNVYKYIGRMTVFVLLAEIPFDLAFSAHVVAWDSQSVMLTLLIGLLTMWGCSLIEKKWQENYFVQWIGFALCLAVGMQLAYWCQTDYAHYGVFSIMAMYFFRKERKLQVLAGALSFLWEEEYLVLLAFLFILLYNGKRGMKMKYFFYAFYPLHLLLIYVVAILMGIHFIPAV